MSMQVGSHDVLQISGYDVAGDEEQAMDVGLRRHDAGRGDRASHKARAVSARIGSRSRLQLFVFTSIFTRSRVQTRTGSALKQTIGRLARMAVVLSSWRPQGRHPRLMPISALPGV